MRIVILGLSITSSWANGHATNYRGLLSALQRRGHDVLFLERDVPWYAGNRDFDAQCVHLYRSPEELRHRFKTDVREADLVVHGSYVSGVGDWLTREARGILAFYDIDTPVTLSHVDKGTCDYLTLELVPRYDLYLSFTGGTTLNVLERRYGARRARPFYCLVDPERYRPHVGVARYELGYLGTYDRRRQPRIDQLLLEPASRLPDRRFVVAGAQYPPGITWPANVKRVEHVPSRDHEQFYASQRLTLNVTRHEMVVAGWSPSVRLFEAAACAVPIVSDWWPGLEEFFLPGEEILIARTTSDVLRIVTETSADDLERIGHAAHQRILREHTADHRAKQLEEYVAECEARVA